jgi:uncharacterized protein (UPF0332 family)
MMRFLARLKKENKLQLGEPSEAIKDSYLKKAESNLLSAKILLDNDLLEESVSIAYYSMYHMLTALLFRTGIKCENHAAAILPMKKVFGLDNRDIAYAKEERIDKQYYINFNITRQEVAETIETAQEFNKKLFDFIARLNNQQINDFRNKFIDLMENLTQRKTNS